MRAVPCHSALGPVKVVGRLLSASADPLHGLDAGTGVSVLPWSEMDSLQLETGYIKDQLVALNRKGFLTINSQPGVNGVCSTDPKVGWGGPNG